MTREQLFFINALRDHLHRQKTSAEDGIDWAQIYELSNNHQVTAIIYYQCKEIIPGDYIDAFKKPYYVTLALSSLREDFLEKLEQSFDKEKVPYLIVKGPFVAKCYPVPQLRSMGDVDILSGDSEGAEKILTDIGAKRDRSIVTEEKKYLYDKLEIELHRNLVNVGQTIGEEAFADYFNDIWDKPIEKIEEFQFLVLIRHLRKHMANTGAGIRHFYDIATQINNNSSLDWKYIKDKMDELSITDFAMKCFAFIEKWFGIKPPIGCADIDEDFFAEGSRMILENGIFGAESEINIKARTANKVINSKHPKLSMLWNAVKLVFPSYSDLKKKYKFVNGRPYLLPIAWIYRFFNSLIKGRGAHGRESLKYEFVSSEKIEQRKYIYKKWGL